MRRHVRLDDDPNKSIVIVNDRNATQLMKNENIGPLAVIENEQAKKLLWKALIGRIYIRFPLFHFSDHALPLGGGTSATARHTLL